MADTKGSDRAEREITKAAGERFVLFLLGHIFDALANCKAGLPAAPPILRPRVRAAAFSSPSTFSITVKRSLGW
jgi:hypothetical protein